MATTYTVTSTVRNLVLGAAAALAVGTGVGTVAAGDDSRITGAVQSSTLTTRGDLLRRGASAPERFAAATADTFVGGDGTDVAARTAAQVRASLGDLLGLDAARPAPSAVRTYTATDTGAVYADDGAAWSVALPQRGPDRLGWHFAAASYFTVATAAEFVTVPNFTVVASIWVTAIPANGVAQFIVANESADYAHGWAFNLESNGTTWTPAVPFRGGATVGTFGAGITTLGEHKVAFALTQSGGTWGLTWALDGATGTSTGNSGSHGTAATRFAIGTSAGNLTGVLTSADLFGVAVYNQALSAGQLATLTTLGDTRILTPAGVTEVYASRAAIQQDRPRNSGSTALYNLATTGTVTLVAH